MSEYYNIGLLPDEVTSTLLIENANLLRPHTNGYLLGDNALPHVTLCQFTADEAQLTSIKSALDTLQKNISVRTLNQEIRTGTGLHQGFDWVQTAIESMPELWTLQKDVFELIIKHQADALNHPDTYEPHITYGRVANKMCDNSVLSLFKDLPDTLHLTLGLGRSTPNGEWTKNVVII